jgi:hypothetical protein
MMARRVVNLSVLRGEPTDGSGRVCVHLFVVDEAGPFIEPHVLHPVIGEDGQPIKQQLSAKPTRGRLACDKKRKVAPVVRAGVTTVTLRSDDPRAVSCPRCKASPEYAAIMVKLEGG